MTYNFKATGKATLIEMNGRIGIKLASTDTDTEGSPTAVLIASVHTDQVEVGKLKSNEFSDAEIEVTITVTPKTPGETLVLDIAEPVK